MEPQATTRTGLDLQRLRFVVLRHEGYGRRHWDLMVEIRGQETLATWRVGMPPERWPGTLTAERIADHRRAYLEYEGEIAGNRGRVVRVAEGVAEWEGSRVILWLGNRLIDCGEVPSKGGCPDGGSP